MLKESNTIEYKSNVKTLLSIFLKSTVFTVYLTLKISTVHTIYKQIGVSHTEMQSAEEGVERSEQEAEKVGCVNHGCRSVAAHRLLSCPSPQLNRKQQRGRLCIANTH